MVSERTSQLFPTAGDAHRYCQKHGLEISMVDDNLWFIAEALYNAEHSQEENEPITLSGYSGTITEWILDQSMAVFISRLPETIRRCGINQGALYTIDVDEESRDGFVIHEDLGNDVGVEFFLTKQMISTAKLNREDDSITFETQDGPITLKFYTLSLSRVP